MRLRDPLYEKPFMTINQPPANAPNLTFVFTPMPLPRKSYCPHIGLCLGPVIWMLTTAAISAKTGVWLGDAGPGEASGGLVSGMVAAAAGSASPQQVATLFASAALAPAGEVTQHAVAASCDGRCYVGHRVMMTITTTTWTAMVS